MDLKWTGGSGGDRRIISKRDWSDVTPEMGGPIDHETVVWDASNGFVNTVDDAAGEFLLKYDTEFKHPTARDLRAAGEEDEEG